MTNRDPYPGRTPSEKALEDRRQSAREAAYDAAAKSHPFYQTRAAMEAGIEVATRVQITHEVIDAFIRSFASAGLEMVE